MTGSYDDPIGNVTDSIDLERLKFEVLYNTDRRIIAQQVRMTIDPVEYLAQQMALRLEAYFLGRRVEEPFVTGSEEVPADWSSHALLALAGWLDRHESTWFPVGGPLSRLCRRHARTRTIATKATLYRVCPHIDVKYPDDPQIHLAWLKAGALPLRKVSTAVDGTGSEGG